MRPLVWIVGLFLGAVAAPPASAADLGADMAATRQVLLDWRLSNDVPTAQAEIRAMADRLHELAAQREVWADEAPRQAWQGWLFLADGELGFGRALLKAPCPDSLDEGQCLTYRMHLADKAAVWLRRALDAAHQAHHAKPPRKAHASIASLKDTLDGLLADAHALAPPGADGPWIAVREDAWFHAPDGQKARVSGWAHPEERPPIRVRFVEDRGDRVLVEVAPKISDQSMYHCLGGGPLRATWRVRLEVDADDVVLVTAQPIDATYDDGTAVHLPKGVPVDADGHPRVHDALLPIVVPELHRARTWESRGTYSPFLPSAARIALDSVLHLNGEPITIDRDQKYVMPRGWDTRDGVTYATFRSSCGEVVTKVIEGEPLGEDPSMLGGILGRLGEGFGTTFTLPAGAALTWTDGSDAGATTTRVQVDGAELEQVDGRRCTRARMGYLHYGQDVPDDVDLLLCSDDWLTESDASGAAGTE